MSSVVIVLMNFVVLHQVLVTFSSSVVRCGQRCVCTVLSVGQNCRMLCGLWACLTWAVVCVSPSHIPRPRDSLQEPNNNREQWESYVYSYEPCIISAGIGLHFNVEEFLYSAYLWQGRSVKERQE